MELSYLPEDTYEGDTTSARFELFRFIPERIQAEEQAAKLKKPRLPENKVLIQYIEYLAAAELRYNEHVEQLTRAIKRQRILTHAYVFSLLLQVRQFVHASAMKVMKTYFTRWQTFSHTRTHSVLQQVKEGFKTLRKLASLRLCSAHTTLRENCRSWAVIRQMKPEVLAKVKPARTMLAASAVRKAPVSNTIQEFRQIIKGSPPRSPAKRKAPALRKAL